MCDATADWPVSLRGVTEAIVTTYGPNDQWNVAALGLFAGSPVTARTWGNTRTRKNFHEQGEGYIQFSRDPGDFVDAACSIREEPDPILPSADAWALVTVELRDTGITDGTQWDEWSLYPTESQVVRKVVPTTNRGYNAVIEATIAASRLDVTGYDTAELRERLVFLESVVSRCGGPAEQAAFEKLRTYVDW